MDFFSRLRQLSLAVEKNVGDIQQSFDLPRSEDDSTDGAALILLHEIKNDVNKVKESARLAMQSLHEGPPFMEIVSAAIALMEREKALLTETEEHLQQYGYTPMLPPSVEIENGSGDTNGATRQEPEEPDPVKHDGQPTALGAGDSPVAPVLQSLAIARNFSSKYKLSNDVEVPRTYSDQTLDISRHAAQQNVVIATYHSDPGSVDVDSPIPPVLQTPGIKKIEKKLEMVIQRTNNEVVSEDSPIPPVLQTPGVKQLNNFIVDKNGDRVHLPAAPRQHYVMMGIPKSSEMTVNYQTAMEEKELPKEPTLSAQSDQLDTPEPPEMTFNYRDFVKMMTSRQQQAQMTVISREPAGQSTGGVHNHNMTTSVFSPWTQSHSSTVAVVTPMCRQTRTQNPNVIEPSLGARYQQAMAEDTIVENHRTQEPTGARNGFPASRWEDDDDDLPAPPELTINLQDLINLKIRAPDGARYTSVNTTSAPLSTTAALCGTAPRSTTTSASTRASGIPLRNRNVPLTSTVSQELQQRWPVAEVMGEEYQHLPDYVTRSLSQQLVNAAVKIVNEVLTSPSGDHQVRESCLNELLGSHKTKSFFLAMMSLGRLHCDVNHMRGEPVYFLPDDL